MLHSLRERIRSSKKMPWPNSLGRAGADIARLAVSARGGEWVDVPPAVLEAIDRAAATAEQGHLSAAERELTRR